jgi:integrase
MKITSRSGWKHLDVTIDGQRYREALDTKDHREAKARALEFVTKVKAGKIAAASGRTFSRLPFKDAAEVYQKERLGKVADRTMQFESERLKPLLKFFGVTPLRTIKPESIAAYQQKRIADGVSGRTINMETSVIRRILAKGKLFVILAEFPKNFPEHEAEVGRALAVENKMLLFRVAGTRPGWMVAHCAAALAASTTCRGVELKNLRWRDVDLMEGVITLRRSKNAAGRRGITLNGDSLAALARLWERAQAVGSSEPEHFVFPACEHGNIDPTRHQKSWRTAWRALVHEAATQAGRNAARTALANGKGLSAAKSAWRRAAAALAKFRFHDLRHQAITELAETGASDATLMALAGHMSRRMMEHYSHVRTAAKRDATDKLESGLMGPTTMPQPKLTSDSVN